jgi:hypothetical protein
VRHHEAGRPDEVSRDPQQHFALRKRFGNEAKLVLLEVSQPAVDQLRGCRGRRAGEIVLLDEQHGETAARGVARDPCAVDAATDHEQIVEGGMGNRSLQAADYTVRSTASFSVASNAAPFPEGRFSARNAPP